VACIPKSVTPARIQQNVQVSDFCLSEEDMQQMASFDRNERLIVPAVEASHHTPTSSSQNTSGGI